MHWLTAQHLHIVDWPIQPNSCSKPGTGMLSVYSWYITTAERTEQISEKQESFMEQDNRARSCLTNREWHVAIRVGVLPGLLTIWESFEREQEETWSLLCGGVLPERVFVVVSKPSEKRAQSKERRRIVKGKKLSRRWGERADFSMKEVPQPRAVHTPQWEVESLHAPCTSVKTCKALGCHHKSPTCLSLVLLVSPPVFTQRCVLEEGCMKPTLLEELLLGGSTSRATIISEKQEKSLAHLREGFKLSLTKWFPCWDRLHSCQEQLQVRL